MKLLFLHGWGFDAAMWSAVRRLLAPIASVALDRSYFGAPCDEPGGVPPAGPLLAIGHSLGSLILASDPPPGCVGLVAINGFDRFAGEGAVPSRTLERMQRRFDEAPAEVLDAFRARCGAQPHAGTLVGRRLADDLDRLATADARGRTLPRLVLHGASDPILPAAMRQATFAGAEREELAGAGHLLPITHPEWCAARIRAVLP